MFGGQSNELPNTERAALTVLPVTAEHEPDLQADLAGMRQHKS
jgi:hypothetical protein